MNGRILIVDDSQGDIVFITKLMKHSQFSFDSVSTAEECEAYLQEEIPMAVILDYILGSSNSLELIEKYHSMVPIILLTGMDDPEIGLNAVKKGAQDFLSKGSLNAELLEKSLNYAMERQILKNRVSNIEKMATIGRLSSGVAHEMNTPIQYVSDNIYFFEKEFKTLIGKLKEISDLSSNSDSGNLQESIQGILAEVDFDFLNSEVPDAVSQSLQGMAKLSKLVKALKNFAVEETNQLEKLNVNDIIQGVISSINAKNSAEMDIHFSAGEDIRSVLAEDRSMKQVIENILENSVYELKNNYTRQQQRGTINISTRQNPYSLEIKISDSGNGISEDVIGHIFEPFFTTKRFEGNLGQGLAVVHRIINEVFEGSIKASSPEGKGAEFIINIPNMKVG
ncbi:MAG: ATP-binding protein [Lentisphaeraceae bacterium]|nr:ATP-binding protein [Lentisphaeraceae bacterium]